MAAKQLDSGGDVDPTYDKIKLLLITILSFSFLHKEYDTYVTSI